MGKRSLVVELREEAMNGSVPVVNLLRRAKVIATKLKLDGALVWINDELDGYPHGNVEDLPQYRVLRGVLKGLNPYQGWVNVRWKDDEFAERATQAPLAQAIGSLEHGLSEDKNASMEFALSPKQKAILHKIVPGASDMMLELSPNHIWGIVDAVRNLVLNWALELEQNGVRGDGVDFSEHEQKEASVVTHNYFIQNAGVVGNVSDAARIETKQSAKIELDVSAWRDFVKQVQASSSMLPDPQRKAVEPIIDTLESETQKEKPSGSVLAETGRSLRVVCEGAAGNLAASGILSLLKPLL